MTVAGKSGKLSNFLQNRVGHNIPQRFPVITHKLDELGEPEDPDPYRHLLNIEVYESSDFPLVAKSFCLDELQDERDDQFGFMLRQSHSEQISF